MRWLEGFERCAELAARLPDTRWVYVADRECDIHEFMVRARRQPQIDWLIQADARDLEQIQASRAAARAARHPDH